MTGPRPPARRAWILPAVSAALGALAAGAVCFALGAAGSSAGAAARKSVAGTVALAAVSLPILFACAGGARALAALAAAAAGACVALVLYSAALDPGAAAAVVLAFIYVMAFCAFAAGLSAALSRAVGRPAVARAAAVMILLAASTTTFTTKGLYRELDGSPALRRGAVSLSVAANPFVMAMRVLALHSSGEGSYSPIEGPVLYEMWVGTDFPLAYPSWQALAARWAALGLGLLAVSTLLPRLLERRALRLEAEPC